MRTSHERNTTTNCAPCCALLCKPPRPALLAISVIVPCHKSHILLRTYEVLLHTGDSCFIWELTTKVIYKKRCLMFIFRVQLLYPRTGCYCFTLEQLLTPNTYLAQLSTLLQLQILLCFTACRLFQQKCPPSTEKLQIQAIPVTHLPTGHPTYLFFSLPHVHRVLLPF